VHHLNNENDIEVVTINMGYGHWRPAYALAQHLGTPILESDSDPLAGPIEQARWAALRRRYERISRLSQLPLLGWPLRRILDFFTRIEPLHPNRDLSKPSMGAKYLKKQILQKGLGSDLANHFKKMGSALLPTFYGPAIAADYLGCERIYCLVTDSDVNRVWVPADSQNTRITYLAPAPRTVRRLLAYGVPRDRILLTGFPLPPERLGGPDLPTLRHDLAQRLGRLDRKGVFRKELGPIVSRELGHPLDSDSRPPTLAFAVGGAGAQKELAPVFLRSLLPLLRDGKLRCTLIAGVRPEVKAYFETTLSKLGATDLLDGPIQILFESQLTTYFDRFNAALETTDILWTKPSELTFYGALGIPLLLAPPIGVHEIYNGRWATENGAALHQYDPRCTGDWLSDWLDDGTLAHAAWCGYTRLPKQGIYNIGQAVASR
jgi:hypothetical protein